MTKNISEYTCVRKVKYKYLKGMALLKWKCHFQRLGDIYLTILTRIFSQQFSVNLLLISGRYNIQLRVCLRYNVCWKSAQYLADAVETCQQKHCWKRRPQQSHCQLLHGYYASYRMIHVLFIIGAYRIATDGSRNEIRWDLLCIPITVLVEL